MKIKVTINSLPKNYNLDEYTGTGNFYKDLEFFINSDIKNADVWFIVDFPFYDDYECYINKENVFFLSSETGFFTEWWLKKEAFSFLDNFSKIFSFYNINRNNVIKSPPFQYWTINGFHGMSQFNKNGIGINYHKNSSFIKDKNFCVLHSNRVNIPGHKKRVDFLNNIQDQLKENIHWFGAGVGINDFIKKDYKLENVPNGSNKLDVLKRYKYNLAIENKKDDYVFTEKLMDSYIALSYPIYYGANNLDTFFPKESFIAIDINNTEDSIEIIKDVIKSDLYIKNKESLIEARKLCLTKYNIVDRLAKITEKYYSPGNKEKVVLPNFKCHFGED